METPTPPEDVARLRAAIERAEPSAALQARVEREVARTRGQRMRRRRVGVGVLAAAAALAATVVLLLQNHDTTPTVAQVVRVAATAPRGPAPAVARRDSRRLVAHLDGIWFPSWRSAHWWPTGRSVQVVGGRRAATVYYARGDGTRIAYTVVAAAALPWPAGTRVVTRGWTRFHVYADGARYVVGWLRGRHQCLVVGPRSLPAEALVALVANAA